MNNTPTLDIVKKRHDDLYDKAMERSTSSTDTFRHEVDKLIGDIETVSKTVTFQEDHRWVTEVAMQWEVTYASLFNCPRPIQIASPLTGSFPSTATRDRYTKQEVHRLIEEKAVVRSRIRREIQRRLYGTGPDDHTEKDKDWHCAETLFASEVVEGRLNLVRYLTPDSYFHLENVWWNSVKSLEAYFNWEKRGWTEDTASQISDYRAASEHLSRLLTTPGIKGHPTEFAVVKQYIENRWYVNDNESAQLNTNEGSATERLVRQKAERIWVNTRDQHGDERSEATNWLDAEKYVKMFYENIIPAAVSNNPATRRERTAEVLKAFHFSEAPENGYHVINCFEMALGIYFLDAEIVKTLASEFPAILT